MLRIQIKNKRSLIYFLMNLAKWGYRVEITNPDGDCLYIWMSEDKCVLSHWTNDNYILEIEEEKEKWLYNIFKWRAKNSA